MFQPSIFLCVTCELCQMNNKYENEQDRIIKAYHDRDSSGKRSLYSWNKPDRIINEYSYRAALIQMFAKADIDDLSRKVVLDVGCGNGALLRMLMEWGCAPANLHGIDILETRIQEALNLNDKINYKLANGWSMPFDDAFADIAFANTVFSSILDAECRRHLAVEIGRILKPGGSIFLYDFMISHPNNPNTIGIRPHEVKRMFPGYEIIMKKIILAPPIMRRVAKWSMGWAMLIEYLFPFLRTHAIYSINKPI